ncbi:MAG: UDP-3-O-(3-hydroxymyristoyl)glucosamine N-acyltransferase [Alphaproteobacteria bacterium]|nr:UDP-3-O-(3-hydroxymyristoyl)glucosamine N-acyltransferase [Alphaproteobacteria bacterium]
MPDPRFFSRHAEIALSAVQANFSLQGGEASKAETVIQSLDPLAGAGQNSLALFLDRRLASLARASQSAAILTTAKLRDELRDWGGVVLVHDQPKVVWAQVAEILYPDSGNPVAAARGAIDPTAQIGRDCQIGENTVIGPGVIIGDGARIGSNCSLSHSIIGDGFVLYPNSVIGRPGFGFVPTPRGLLRMPQLGRVIIGHGVEVGSTTTIDRGSLEDTVIGNGCKIDNGVQIAHNCRLGDHCILTGHVGLAGSVTLGSGGIVGGGAVIGDHLKIGDGVQIAMGSVVTRDIAAGAKMAGYPAIPLQQWLRRVIRENRNEGKKS